MSTRPPRWATRLHRWVSDPHRVEAQLGDLAEEHDARARHDPEAAGRWYAKQVLRSVLPSLRYRLGRWYRTRTNPNGEGTMGRWTTDLGMTLRTLRRHVAFHGVIVLTVGLGIGAVATTFSVVYGLVLDPFPFPEPDRIVGVGSAYPRLGTDLEFFESLSPAEYVDIRDNTTTLEDVVAWDMGNRQIDGEGPPENVFSAFWWGDVLETLQMDAHLGRGFTEDEIRTGAPVAMLSHDVWTDRFGSDSTLVGDAVSVNGSPYTVVGVVPPGVDIYGTGLWMPMSVTPEVYPRNRRQFQVMGRIAAGASLAGVNAELAGIAGQVEDAWSADFDEYAGWSLQAMTWTDVNSMVFRTGLMVLMGAVTFVLLLVCANTANLLLARAHGRRREMALRRALGAGRGRIVTQLLTESVALGVLGGALGIALSFLAVRGVNGLLSVLGLPVAGSVEVNGPVLAFAAVVAVGAGVLFGLAPALHVSSGIQGALQSASRGATGGGSHQRIQRTLVGVQVALAFLLLTGSGLLVNSFVRVHAVEPGFEPEQLLTMRLTLPREEYRGDAVPAFFRELTERVEAIPGVARSAAGSQYPGVAFSFREILFDDTEVDAGGTIPTTLGTVVTRGYFDALGVPLVRGRTFSEDDVAGAPLVAVINEAAALRYLGSTDVVGRRLKLGDAGPEAPWWEIVGVVGSTRNLGLDQEPFPEIFAHHPQMGDTQNQLFLVTRTRGEPRSYLPAIRQTVQEMDPDQPVYAIRTVEETYAQRMAPVRAATLFLSILGVFALVLAAVGIYSVVSYTVSERKREIGLRVALGADGGRVQRLVVGQALLPVVLGAGVGLLLAFLGGRGLDRLLYEVRGTDPSTFAAAALLLVGVAAVASWIPAFRASRLDPVASLRRE